MSACEPCWYQAYFLARTRGGHQVDHYRDLLAKNHHTPDPDTHLTDARAPETGAEQ